MSLVISKEDFFCLTLIYCGHVDYNFNKDERQFIIEKYGNENYQKMYDIFLNKGEKNTLKYLLDQFDLWISNKEDFKSLRMEVIGLFESDGIICGFEKSFLQYLDLLNEKRNSM